MLSIVIPAYNEENRLPATLRKTLGFLESAQLAYEVIVVDDGSQDGTADLVAEMASSSASLRLIRLAQNEGKGFAVRIGLINANGERILFMDADAGTDFHQVVHLSDVMTKTGADIVIGSRALPGNTTTVKGRWYRHVAGRFFNHFVRIYGVPGIADTQCGFKLFSRNAALAIASRMRMHGYSFDVEMLLIARALGFEIREVSVNSTHQPGSKVAVVPDGMRMVADVIRVRRNSARGLYKAPRLDVRYVEDSLSQSDMG